LIKATERVSESYQNLARLQKEKSALDQSKTTEENAFDRTLAKYKIDPKELADKTLESAQTTYSDLDKRTKELEKLISQYQQAQFAAGAQVDALRFKYTALDKKKTDSCAGGKSVCLLGRDDCNNTFLKGIEEEMVAVTLEGTTAKVKFDEAKKWTDEYSHEINSVRNFRDWWFGACSLIPAREKIDIYSKSIRSLEGQIDISQKQIDDNDVSLDDVAAKGLEVKGVKSRIESIRQTQSGIQNEIGKLQGTLERKTGYEKGLTETMALIETKKEDVVVYEILQKAYSKDGIPALMIERLVPALEADANQFLEKLSGGSISLAFYLQKKLKQGGFSDGFEIFVTDPDGTRAIRMYSGGEKFRIIFAIHMAFSKYLSYRNGASIRCIFLDEPASSLDKKGIESFMACLASIKENYDQLFCITHLSELQEYFGDVLRVEKTATGSKIIGADDPAEKYL
jgi:exonuclease SbcC